MNAESCGDADTVQLRAAAVPSARGAPVIPGPQGGVRPDRADVLFVINIAGISPSATSAS